jgi:preprotein translocase subunit YajC
MDPTMMLLFWGALLLVFWLFFIRPQQRKQKEAAEFIAKLDKGDKVVTTGGIHGKVVRADEGTLLIEVDANVKLRIERSGISAEMTQAVNAGKKDEASS